MNTRTEMGLPHLASPAGLHRAARSSLCLTIAKHALAQEQPYTFFYFPERLDGVNRRLRGVEMDARGEWLNVKDWWIER